MKTLYCLSTIAIISAAYAEVDQPIGHIDLRLTKAAETESAPVKYMLGTKPIPLPTFVNSKKTAETKEEKQDKLEKESKTGATFLFSLQDGVLKPVVGISYDFPGTLNFSSGLLSAFKLSGGYVKLTVINGLGASTIDGQSSSGIGFGLTSAVSENGKTASFFIGGWAPNYNVSKGTLLIGVKF